MHTFVYKIYNVAIQNKNTVMTIFIKINIIIYPHWYLFGNAEYNHFIFIFLF